MRIAEDHPSEREMLGTADGELPRRQAARVRAHLVACWACRTRMAEIEAGIREFVQVQRAELDPLLPDEAGPRALFKARLAGLAEGHETARPWFPVSMRAGVLGACAVLVAGAVALGGRLLLKSREAAVIPLARLTPGATLPATRDTVCRVDASPATTLIPAAVRQAVLDRYGLSPAQAGAYEIDYLITPELGGSDDMRNLWPEPYSNTVWNASVKDALEARLHALVCQGALDLRAAQSELATDWIAAYKRHFHTDRPIAP